jgi:tRNA pseudouridine38-40 synthase
MARFRLDLEYLGTRYSGWQIQKNARTVQGALHEAVRRVSGRGDFASYGAGRTDAGVHALRQVAHLDLETRLAPEALLRALNDELPSDVNVLRAVRVSRRFHARHSAQARAYLYQIARRRTAFGKALVYWVRDPLDLDAMTQAASLFEGRHDFAFYSDLRSSEASPSEARPSGGRSSRAPAKERSTRVVVERVQLEDAGDLVLFRIVASHFLWKMVRRIVGVLVEVGRGGLRVRDAQRFLEGRSDVPARLTAPPSGLFLERVFYEGEPAGREGERPEVELPLRPVLDLR